MYQILVPLVMIKMNFPIYINSKFNLLIFSYFILKKKLIIGYISYIVYIKRIYVKLPKLISISITAIYYIFKQNLKYVRTASKVRHNGQVKFKNYEVGHLCSLIKRTTL